MALSNRVSVDSMSNLDRIKVSRVRFVCVWGGGGGGWGGFLSVFAGVPRYHQVWSSSAERVCDGLVACLGRCVVGVRWVAFGRASGRDRG